MSNHAKAFASLPGRILLDTCILNALQDFGGFIFENEEDGTEDDDLVALQKIFVVNERAAFQFVVSPITFAELANETDMLRSQGRIRWALDCLDNWLIMLEDAGDRVAEGGSVRHRFKLNDSLQEVEAALLEIQDFKRDPLDRLLLIQYKMAGCDAFVTKDRNTIWRHRTRLADLGFKIFTPAEYWNILSPWARLWR